MDETLKAIEALQEDLENEKAKVRELRRQFVRMADAKKIQQNALGLLEHVGQAYEHFLSEAFRAHQAYESFQKEARRVFHELEVLKTDIKEWGDGLFKEVRTLIKEIDQHMSESDQEEANRS